jgi:hypothetical protein
MNGISRADLYTPVVKALRKCGGSASISEIGEKVRWDLFPGENAMTESDLLVLDVITVIEDLERNGMVQSIDGEKYRLSH